MAYLLSIFYDAAKLHPYRNFRLKLYSLERNFYPPKMKTTDYFTFYAQHFDVAEVNTSFYLLTKYETV
jgi:hypothetical protein